MAKLINYDVPFFSQQSPGVSEEWRYRGCGISALKMVLDYWHAEKQGETTGINQILETGLAIGAYLQNIGWIHSGLVNIGRQYGYTGYNQDLAGLETELAWQCLLEDLNKHPLLASIHKRFDVDYPGGHIIVVTGFDGELVFYNDPDEHNEREGKKMIAVERFLRGWKKRYIVVAPSK